MNTIDASYKIEKLPSKEDMKLIEAAGRVCYKSEERTTDTSFVDFLEQIVRRGHESVLEHSMLTVRFICDRGVSHELVRHRLASFSQESTRYCNYGSTDEDNITVIQPSFLPPFVKYEDVSFAEKEQVYTKKQHWYNAVNAAELCYKQLLLHGCSPQVARCVLPTCLKTEVVMTANLREWRHILKLRTSKAAHPQMRELMCPLLDDLKASIPVIFDDIEY
jgi:thymidylate synthase (FAD)